MKINYITILLAGLSLNSFAQKMPAKQQINPVCISGANIHIGNGEVISNGYIVFDNGKIIETGKGKPSFKKNNLETIDAKGKEVYAGFIAPNTRLGLEEIESIRATRDYSEVGNLNPNVRSLISFNTDSKIIPTVRSNGVLITEACPQGSGISGTSSAMNMDGWNWEDAQLKADIGIHLYWPSQEIRTAWWAPKAEIQKENYEKELSEFTTFFKQAKSYAALNNPENVNLKLEACKGLFSGDKKLFIHADYRKDIIESIFYFKSIGISNLVIVGGGESILCIDFLKKNNIPVVLANPHSLPYTEDEDVDLPYRKAKILMDSGILVGLNIEGSWQNRNLPFVAGTCVANGLDKEEALKCISSNTAKILGIDNLVGSLELGKMATLFISEGDALDMRTNNVSKAFINGVEVDLNNKQKELNQKYLEKYELN